MSNLWSREQRLSLAVLLALLLLSAAVMWHDLAAHEVLGRDENATIVKLDQPDLKAVYDAVHITFTGQASNMQPLYFLLQRLLWPLVGQNAFVLRYVTAAFGILVVALTYKLGEALFGRPAGLLGGLLTALLPVHVRYAQIARPYTLLAAFSLASAYFLVRALSTNRPAHWAGFVAAATLNFYNHFNALFVLLAEGLFAGLVWLSVLVAVVQKRAAPRRLLGPVLGFLALGLLCAPGLIQLLGLPWVGAGEVPGASDRVAKLAIPFFRHWLYMSGLQTIAVQNLVFALTLLGLGAALVRRQWRAALFAVLWLGVPFVTLSMIRSPRPFEERYVIFVTPVLLLVIAYGVVSAGQVLGRWARRWRAGWLSGAAIALASAGLVLLLVLPLQAYYARNREEGRLGETLAVVERHASAEDLILVSPRVLVRPLDASGARVVYLADHLSPAELDRLAGGYPQVWVLYTSYLPPLQLQEPLDLWVQSHPDELVRVGIKAVNALAFGTLGGGDAESTLLQRIAVLEELAREDTGQFESWQRHDLLADAYQALGDLYHGRGETALAEEYWLKAAEARTAVPPP